MHIDHCSVSENEEYEIIFTRQDINLIFFTYTCFKF